MTDEQIIKALEYCIEQGFTSDCTECEYRCSSKGCVMSLLIDVLFLINRQKAELQHYFEASGAKQVMADARTKAIKEFAERVKEKTLAMVWSPELLSTADYVECIDSLVKEMVGD